ncbi:MAG: hypothetical protein QOI80_871 [Solirubrobacteraceae bacterium]|nr:hypothetical protein [Solirubrobacteraceae bacterium]
MSYQAHRHNTGGHDWHVQLEVNKQATKLKTLVVYSQLCHETAFTQKVKLGPDDTFDIDRPTPDKKGRWVVHARFTHRSTAEGTWQITRGDCTDSREFEASTRTQLSIGNQREYPPPKRITTGPGRAAHKLRHIKNQALLTSKRLDTVAEAEAHGYQLDRTNRQCPGFHHARKNGNGFWGNMLDPEAPQALVFWCDSHHRFTLGAYMFRAPRKPRPNVFNGLIQWHRHGLTPNYLWMTHLWLVRSPVAAWATCAPFNALDDAGVLAYEKPAFPGAHSEPCTDTKGLDE